MTLKKSADGQQTLRRLCFLSVLVAALAAVAVKLWFHPPQASASVSHSSKPDLEVGFCDSTGHGFYREQPADQLERWDLPYDNGTHVVILWKNDKRVSGRNVSMYHVDVRTSVPVLNFFVGQFGGFPQDVCAPGGSKARNQVNVEGSAGACSPYGLEDHHVQRRTAFEIPPTLRKLAKWDIDVRVRGYGAHTPIGRPKEEVRTTWWCKVYRRPRDESDQPATAYRGGSSRRTTRADASHGEHGQGELLTLPRRLLAPRLRAFGDRAKRLLNR